MKTSSLLIAGAIVLGLINTVGLVLLYQHQLQSDRASGESWLQQQVQLGELQECVKSPRPCE